MHAPLQACQASCLAAPAHKQAWRRRSPWCGVSQSASALVPRRSAARGLAQGQHFNRAGLRNGCRATSNGREVADIEGPSTDLRVIYTRLSKLALPYWVESPQARWKLAGVVGLTLATTGVSVAFNFLGRDFFNALAERDADAFTQQLIKYLVAFGFGIPVFVFKGYYQSRLSLEWREWMTSRLLQAYFSDRSFYQLQARGLVDNPDQRISADVRSFTDTALSLSLTLLNSVIDLVSFAGILYSIYPPLFAALLAYSIGGTAASVALGKGLVQLNFNQEAREADLRYGLVRVRENAEAVAFYGGEGAEATQLTARLRNAVANYGQLLIASRNLDFFTSFYRFLIQLLPAAVVAPLYFANKIEFGVINQSQSAFNHILNDVSLVVYQFEALAGFSAVVDRLGEFQDVVDAKLRHFSSGDASSNSGSGSGALGTGSAASEMVLGSGDGAAADPAGAAAVVTLMSAPADPGGLLLRLDDVSITTPDAATRLVSRLSLCLYAGGSLLIMGPSGTGKTSLLRTLAGLWESGSGVITSYGLPGLGNPGCKAGGVLFLPQRPYMVLGSLRDQLLYPVWSAGGSGAETGAGAGAAAVGAVAAPPPPGDAELRAALRTVQLAELLQRFGSAGGADALDFVADWSQLLSLGEQQRLAFARLLLARPRLALLDEATSALDGANEAKLYQAVADAGITVISVGHRDSLMRFHARVLQLSTPAGSGGGVGGEVERSWRLLEAAEAMQLAAARAA